MAPELLVDDRIEDGARLTTELVRDGFDVSAAFWVCTQEEGLWFLYVASASVTRDSYANAYRTLYATLTRLDISAITLSNVKLVAPDNPIAVDAVALRDRHPVRIPTRVGAGRLGGVAIREAHIYPPIDRALSRREVLQAVTALMDRTGFVPPSAITLRDGSTFLAIPIGVQVSQAGGDVTVTLREFATGRSRSVPADEITAIQ